MVHPHRPRVVSLRFIHVATGTGLVAMLALAMMSPGSTVAAGQFPESSSCRGKVSGRHRHRPGLNILRWGLFSGDIFRGDLRTGAVERFIHPPTGRMALGLKADVRHGLLFVAGGSPARPTSMTSRPARTWPLPARSFINDCRD